MPETPYTETEALIHAMNDYDADSGNIDATLDYLAENLTPGEIRRLSGAAMLLSRACSEARGTVARASHSHPEPRP